MYQVEAGASLRKALRMGVAPWRTGRVSRNVVVLGLTSLLTDVSAEMVATVLPIYVVLHLGLTPLYFGILDGLNNGATAVLRLVGGVIADRWGHYKEVALVGYCVSAICKLGLLVVGSAWTLILGIVAVDRAAKGLRVAPRDALISFSSRPRDLATSYGVHRALDATGAMLGPLIALAILAVAQNGFGMIFVSSFSVAVIGCAVLLFFVENARRDVEAVVSTHGTGGIRLLVDQPGFRGLVGVAAVLSVVTVSDGFIYLELLQGLGTSAGIFPFFYVGTAGVYLLLAAPVGRLADRFGRRTMFVFGYFILAFAYLTALGSEGDWVGSALCLVLLGSYYAMTDGVLMALGSSILPVHLRGTGLATLATATSLGRLVASLSFGGLWTAYGTDVPFLVFFVALLLAASISIVLLRRNSSDE